jgi:REP element-mobilizing transposase RayT
MESYKRGSHSVWDCKYHIVWVAKYGFPILGGDVGERCRELIRETARAHEMVIHAGSINRIHAQHKLRDWVADVHPYACETLSFAAQLLTR